MSNSTVVGTLPQQVTCLASLVVRDRMIIFGGKNSKGSNSEVYVFSLDNFTTTTLPVKASPNFDDAAFALLKGNL